MSSPTETQVAKRQIAGHEIVIWRNNWPDGAVTYSAVFDDEQLGGEDFDHVPTAAELTRFLPGYDCGICGEHVVTSSAVVLPRLREHLEGHNVGAQHLEASEVFEQFTERT